MWQRARDDDGRGERVAVRAGVSVRIPPRTDFQFRSGTSEPLVAVGVSMPPWPGGGISGKGEVFSGGRPVGGHGCVRHDVRLTRHHEVSTPCCIALSCVARLRSGSLAVMG